MNDSLSFSFGIPQRVLKMVDGLNFKDFVAFLSAFSAKASIQRKIECTYKMQSSNCLDPV